MKALTAYDNGLAALIMVSFFLPIRLQVGIIIPIIGFWAIRDAIAANFKEKLFYWKHPLLLSIVYLLYVSYIFFTPKEYMHELRSQLEYKASMALMPVAFLFLNKKTLESIYNQIHWFVAACAVSCLVGNIAYLSHFGFHVSNTQHVFYRLYFETITDVHPTYMGMYLGFSIAWLLLVEKWRKSLRGWLVVVILMFYLLFVFMLLPKTPVIALGLILMLIIINKQTDKEFKKQLLISTGLALFIGFVFIPFGWQRLNELIFFYGNNSQTGIVDNSINMRQFIWKVDISIWRECWLWGIGPGKLPTLLMMQYVFYSMIIKQPIGYYDTHNEYLNQWISFGIIGLIALLFIIYLHIRQAINGQNRLYLYFTIIIALSFLTENVLSNQHGVVFFTFFSSLFYYKVLYNDRFLESSY